MDPAAVLARFLDAPRVAYILAILDAYGRAAGGLLANGLAFAALFATIPTALVVLGFAGLLANDPQVQQQLADALVEAFPPLADLIEGALDAVVRGAAVTSIVGIIGLIWTVSQLYVALDVAFARIFAATPEREFVWRTARGFVSVGGLLLSVVVLVLLASFLAASRSVSATDADDKLFTAANRGRHIAVSAPGVDILLPAPGSNYQVTSGTSFSAAHVSGIVALVLERKPELSPQAIRQILASTARDLGPRGKDDQFGAGLVDAYEAILSLGGETAAAPSPRPAATR